jgi:hypothetical protein
MGTEMVATMAHVTLLLLLLAKLALRQADAAHLLQAAASAVAAGNIDKFNEVG